METTPLGTHDGNEPERQRNRSEQHVDREVHLVKWRVTREEMRHALSVAGIRNSGKRQIAGEPPKP
jgi:hypothetical protein